MIWREKRLFERFGCGSQFLEELVFPGPQSAEFAGAETKGPQTPAVFCDEIQISQVVKLSWHLLTNLAVDRKAPQKGSKLAKKKLAAQRKALDKRTSRTQKPIQRLHASVLKTPDKSGSWKGSNLLNDHKQNYLFDRRSKL